ncbi:MAG TPA: hypothetical protein VKJ00_01500 [Thermoanaerobaculia bacterium]|nr:hypothetical protein [Thermoanaerobaculia bacterium]
MWTEDLIAAAVLAGLVAALYGTILRLWWTGDDLFHLRFVSTHSPLALGFSPQTWREFPSRMFTPLQLWSYAVDLALFGRHPGGFYVHQLVSVGFAALAFCLALRSWLASVWACLASVLVVLGVPLAAWTSQLMFRHYVEGFFCASLAVWLFVQSVRRDHDAARALASAFFYLLAMLAKEVYVPLVVLLLALPEASWPRRARRLIPHGAVLLLYLIWRWIMLGTLLGGYGWIVPSAEMPRLIASLPARMAAAFSGNAGAAVWPVLVLVLIGTAVLLSRKPGGFVLLGVAALAIAGPIVPVARSLNERFGVLPCAVLAATFGLGCRELAGASAAGRRACAILAALAVAAALVANRLDWRVRYAGAQRDSAEGRFFLSMAPGDLLRRPRVPPAAMQETRRLREETLGLPGGAGWFADDLYLCVARPAGRVWEYDEAARRVADVTGQAKLAAERYCAGLRDAPLAARFESAEGKLFWSLGPYPKGRYALVFDRGVEAVEVDRDSGYQTSPLILTLMVRYRSPEGWTTFSPQLAMDFRAASRYRWERKASMP